LAKPYHTIKSSINSVVVDLKNLEFHLLDTGHFALEEDGDVMASYMRNFLAKHAGSAVTEK